MPLSPSRSIQNATMAYLLSGALLIEPLVLGGALWLNAEPRGTWQGVFFGELLFSPVFFIMNSLRMKVVHKTDYVPDSYLIVVVAISILWCVLGMAVMAIASDHSATGLLLFGLLMKSMALFLLYRDIRKWLKKSTSGPSLEL